MKKNEVNATSAKRAWVSPQIKKLQAGAAESRDGLTPDGGGGAQGS